MIFVRFFDDLLAQSSYLVACEETKHAVVIDPNRDVEQYIEAAEREKVVITHVTETHIHADFVSGARELAARAGAQLILSGSGGLDWQYRFSKDAGARVVRHGDAIDVGTVSLSVRETPGHTPEHLCFLITDRSMSDRPVALATGDFIFVGDVGRPDLLERAADVEGSMEGLARALFQSVRATSDLPDYLQVWPGHGAGSACGKALGAMPFTTLGFERLANWAFQVPDENAFVAEVLVGQPEPPGYFARMKTLNRAGPPPAPAETVLPEVNAQTLARIMASGTVALDVRSSADFAAGHIPGTLHIPVGSSFTRWAGTLVPYDCDIVLLADDATRLSRARQALMLIGMDRVVAAARAGVFAEWVETRGPLEGVSRVDIRDLSSSNGRTLVDVRGAAEWSTGHLPGADHRYLGTLASTMREVPRDEPIALYCQGGTRASIGASILQAAGFTNVATALGGYDAWDAAGLPIEGVPG